ncbi:dihydrofolate reductase family protein [Nonomuraea jabiensis]|uniref:dihydrofolate reductase family protein n=1 Tax=Nonomuraea jabiensis TaxID=882448 RepID=UPI0036A68EAB
MRPLWRRCFSAANQWRLRSSQVIFTDVPSWPGGPELPATEEIAGNRGISMRKIVAELFSSLDGVVGSPYEEHVGYWPTATGGLADRMNDIRKVVFSASLPALEWRNSTLVSGNAIEEIARLKGEPGKDIVVTGSVTLVQDLLRAGLLDELRLLIDPVVVREGRKLFEDEGDRLTCTLLASHHYGTGTISATYAVTG